MRTLLGTTFRREFKLRFCFSGVHFGALVDGSRKGEFVPEQIRFPSKTHILDRYSEESVVPKRSSTIN